MVQGTDPGCDRNFIDLMIFLLASGYRCRVERDSSPGNSLLFSLLIYE